MIRIYVAGLVILVSAIALNLLAQQLSVMGWYEFLTRLQKEGKQLFRSMKAVDPLWLFLIYPLLLGASGWGGFRLGEWLRP
ncbi:MAG: hypothetical protein RJA57_1026 [Bacteroidota bacterium]|jgi:hypothetical protein